MILREEKGSPLTQDEFDNNLKELLEGSISIPYENPLSDNTKALGVNGDILKVEADVDSAQNFLNERYYVKIDGIWTKIKQQYLGEPNSIPSNNIGSTNDTYTILPQTAGVVTPAVDEWETVTFQVINAEGTIGYISKSFGSFEGILSSFYPEQYDKVGFIGVSDKSVELILFGNVQQLDITFNGTLLNFNESFYDSDDDLTYMYLHPSTHVSVVDNTNPVSTTSDAVIQSIIDKFNEISTGPTDIIFEFHKVSDEVIEEVEYPLVQYTFKNKWIKDDI